MTFGAVVVTRRHTMSAELTQHMRAVSEKQLRQVEALVVVAGAWFLALGLWGAWRALS